jgi:hypothetical protein
MVTARLESPRKDQEHMSAVTHFNRFAQAQFFLCFQGLTGTSNQITSHIALEK